MTDPLEGQVQDQDPGKAPVTPEQPDPLQAKLKEAGFNSIDDLVRSQQEAKSTLTRMAQQNALTQRELHQLRQQMAAATSNKSEAWWDDTEQKRKTVDPNDPARPITVTEMQQVVGQLGVNIELKQVRAKNPERFDRLQPAMLKLAAQSPGFYEAIGAEQLLSDAEKEERKQNEMFLKMAFGDDMDLDKLREMAGKKKPGTNQDPRSGMVPPGTAMPGPRGAPGSREDKIQERQAAMKKAEDEGDVDTLIKLKFTPL
uniref:Uncharacterized protein n=1 Tax=viral metagenome TaxID=1070528 RepID=A0A6M3XKY8_9ZZZZ